MLPRPVPAQQILVGSSASLSFQPAGSDGEPAAPAGTVTVGVTKADGTVVVAAGTATAGTGSSPRTYALAAQTTLESLTVTWTDAGDSSTHTQTVEVVGGYWFSRADAIAHDSNLADGAKYPPERIAAVRAEVEAEFEDVTNMAWVPRYRRMQLIGNGSRDLVLPDVHIRRVRSVRRYDAGLLTYTEFTSDDLTAIVAKSWGVLHRESEWARNVVYVVEYEHGADRPPADLRDAAITRLRHRLNAHRSGIPDRATSMSTESGQTYSIATPGTRGFITGIPDVDMVLTRRTFQRIGVA